MPVTGFVSLHLSLLISNMRMANLSLRRRGELGEHLLVNSVSVSPFPLEVISDTQSGQRSVLQAVYQRDE